MTDPFWAWWVAPLWLASGWFTGWLLTLLERPKKLRCPNCENQVPVKSFNYHWKVCND